MINTEKIIDNDNITFDPMKCYDFVYRTLQFIDNLLNDADDDTIYRVSYRRCAQQLECLRCDKNHLLPQWFRNDHNYDV